jgi:hypothetical protein
MKAEALVISICLNVGLAGAAFVLLRQPEHRPGQLVGEFPPARTIAAAKK